MTYLIASFLSIGSFFKRNNKIIFYSFLIFMFILFAWSYQTADWQIYINRFYDYEHTSSDTEFLFLLINKIFASNGLEFRTFLIIISAIIVFGYGIIIKKNSSQTNFVLALYFIFPFIMEVTQIRYTVGSFFAIWGLVYILKDDCTKKDYIYSLILIIIATLNHYALFLTVFFWIAKFVDKKIIIRIVFLTLMLSIVFVYALNSTIVLNGSSVLINKINFVLMLQKDRPITMMIKNLFRMILFFMFNFIIYSSLFKRIKDDSNDRKKVDLVWKWNLVTLIYLPLVFLISDIYRIQQVLCLINYLVYANYFINKDLIVEEKINKEDLKFTLLCIFSTAINLYFLVLDNPNINTVFFPLFNNNIFFNYFFS